MKKSFLIVVFSFLTSIIIASVYDEFLALKVKLYNRKNIEEAELMFEEWDAAFKNLKLNEEDIIAVQNLVTIERANLMQEAHQEKKIYKMLKERETVSLKYLESKKKANVGKWFLLSIGDLKNRLLPYTSWLQAYNESTEAKKCFSDAIKQDDKFSPAYISNALWLFFAPAIAKGGYESSLKNLDYAVYYAKNDTEKYLALLFRSQLHFKMNHTKEYDDDLKVASVLVQDEIFTKYVKKLNEKMRKTFFEK